MRPALLLLMVLAFPASAQDTGTPKKKKAAGSSPAAEARVPEAGVALLKEAVEIRRKTEKLRGLRARRAIPMSLQSRAEILARVEQKLSREYTEQEIQAEADILKRLSLIPAGLDYRGEVLELLKDQVAGYYDPAERKLHLADWLPINLQAPALAHEICHALQDQHFALGRLIKPLKDNSDRQLAQAALVEGDCTGVMLEYAMAPLGKDLGSIDEAQLNLLRAALATNHSGRFKKAPRYLQESLLFPYLQGLRLVQKVRSLHPWSVVNQMFKRPPRSTEQVLHPDKYWKQEAPVVVRGARLPSLSSHPLTKQDVLGEFGTWLLLSQHLEDSLATRASEGWGGDLLQAYRRPGGPLLIVHLSSWDSDADAVEFANAARHWLLARKLKALPPVTDGIWVYQGADKLEWSVQLADQQVLLLMGAAPALRTSLQTETWQHWLVGGRRVSPAAPAPLAPVP